MRFGRAGWRSGAAIVAGSCRVRFRRAEGELYRGFAFRPFFEGGGQDRAKQGDSRRGPFCGGKQALPIDLLNEVVDESLLFFCHKALQWPIHYVFRRESGSS